MFAVIHKTVLRW